jgi:hypothetical protein
LNFECCQGEAARKNWIERKESQIAGNKFTGTLLPP